MTKKFKFTSGPYSACRYLTDNPFYMIYGCGHKNYHPSDVGVNILDEAEVGADTANANAALMASAPEMFDFILDVLDGYTPIERINKYGMKITVTNMKILNMQKLIKMLSIKD